MEFRFRGGAGPQDAGFDREAAQAARETCSGLLEGVTLGLGRGDFTEIQDRLLEFATCMRENGYDMPDPDFGNLQPRGGEGDGQFTGPFGEIDPEDPSFVVASEACSDVLWQESTGVDPDGVVDIGEVVFLPGPVRVLDQLTTPGVRVGSGGTVLDISSADKLVTMRWQPHATGAKRWLRSSTTPRM